ncbi:MAG: hypothetical protein DHS80DRAFT_32511 [Piptocephalis tieghemiana]|nr:MAG: hypothetical protein DHS80DRAFT_32511 [Piptocephalis tieghemiana]
MTAKHPPVSSSGKVKASTLPRRTHHPQASLSSSSLTTPSSSPASPSTSPYSSISSAMSTSSLPRPPRPTSLALFPPRPRSITTATTTSSTSPTTTSPTAASSQPRPRMTRSPSLSSGMSLSNLPLREGSTVPRRVRSVLTWEVACQVSPPPLLTTSTGTDPLPDPLVEERDALKSQLHLVSQENIHLREQLALMERQVQDLQGQLDEAGPREALHLPDIDIHHPQDTSVNPLHDIDTSFTPPTRPYYDSISASSSWNDGSTTGEDRAAVSFYDYADGEDNADEDEDAEINGEPEVNYVENKMEDLWAQIAALESDLAAHRPPPPPSSSSHHASTTITTDPTLQEQPLSTSSPILQGKGASSLQVPPFDLDTSVSASSTLLPPALASSSSAYSSGSTSLITSEEDRQWVRGRGKEEEEEKEEDRYTEDKMILYHEDEEDSFQVSSSSFLDLDVEHQARSQDPDQVEQFFRARSLFEMHSTAPEDSVDGSKWACIPDEEFARMMYSSDQEEEGDAMVEERNEELVIVHEDDLGPEERQGPSDQVIEDRVIRQIGEEMAQLEVHGEGLLFDIDEYDEESKALRKALRTQEQTLQALAMEETEVEERTAVLRVKLAAAIKACGRWKGRGNVGQGYEKRREGLEEALALEDRILSRIHEQVQEGRERAEDLRANWEEMRSQLETAKEAYSLLETTLVHLQRTYEGRVREQRRARMAVDEQHRHLRGWQDGHHVMRELDAVGH